MVAGVGGQGGVTNPFSQQTRDLLQCPYCGHQHPEDQVTCSTSGEVILLDGKYRLKTLLGEGSFGLVWDARNIDTQKEVAIKSLRAEVVNNPAVLTRFFWEATAAGRIHNPHVCDVLDLVKSSAHGPYIVLERLSGRSLEAMIQEHGRLLPETAVLLLRQALVGLEAVHRAGIVHRDIKPENIFLHEPQEGGVLVKLLDFGISKFYVAAGSRARTAADLFMGTPEYTSPEQARGAAQVDLRTDIWAIGAILYKALAGVSPFGGPDVPSVLTAILHTPHRPLTEVAPDVPPGLAAVVDRCLSKDRALRHESCSDLSAALEPFESLSFARTVLGTRSPVGSNVPVLVAALPPELSRSRDDASFSLLTDEDADSDEDLAAADRAPASAGSESVMMCCSPADRRWLDHLRQHLKTHRDGSRLTTVDSGEFGTGARQRDAIEAAFMRARAVILLVSPQFLAEDFAPGGQLYSLVLMALAREVPVMWMMISESVHEGTDLRDFQVLGDPSRPLDRLPFTAADRALEAICDQLVLPLGGPQATPMPDDSRAAGAAAASAKADGTRDLQHRLEMARARKARLDALGEGTSTVHAEINMLRRSLRMGRPLHPGDVLDDRFVVHEQLGAGGFATVWQALDQRTGDAVALKVLHAQHVHNADRRERFFRGARIMAQLDHPHIVKIIEPWASDGEYEYFVMQHVPGGTLRDAVISGRLTVSQRLQALLSVAEALAFAHERGIIHRDVKPSNILVAEDGTPFLTDFDLVRAEDTTGGTAGGLGTVIYAAPEMMERASEADARADVYGLGMTLAFLFYERDLTMDVIRSTDRLIGALKVPESIRMVIRTAITWNRDHRFRSAGEFHSALSAAIVRRDSLPPTTMTVVQASAGQGTLLAAVPPVAMPAVVLTNPPSGTVLAPVPPVPAPPTAPSTSPASPSPAFTPPSTSPPTSPPTSPSTSPASTSPRSTSPPPVPVPSKRAPSAPLLSRRPLSRPVPSAVVRPSRHAPRPEEAASDSGVYVSFEDDPSLSLVKAFAAIARESDALGETAVSEVFAGLEVHEDTEPHPGHAAPRPRPRPRPLVPLPPHDSTLPDRTRRFSTGAAAGIIVGASLVTMLIYFLLTT